MASLAINLNVSTKLLKLSFMRQENGKLPTFRSFNCTLQTQKDEMYFNTFWLPINIKKTLRLPILFVRSMTSSFLIRSWNQRLWRLLHNHCKTFVSSLPPKAKRYPNMLKVAKKKQYTSGKIIERAFHPCSSSIPQRLCTENLISRYSSDYIIPLDLLCLTFE